MSVLITLFVCKQMNIIAYLLDVNNFSSLRMPCSLQIVPISVWLFTSLSSGQTSLQMLTHHLLLSLSFSPPRPWSSSWCLWLLDGRVSGIVWCSHGAGACWSSILYHTKHAGALVRATAPPAICGHRLNGGVDRRPARGALDVFKLSFAISCDKTLLKARTSQSLCPYPQRTPWFFFW